ncbi:MAG: hypothetical protein M3124_01820 [Actinomycetota bacterium]|nr:hypothetical protein [Actinomycetota bacterium]
MPGAEELFRRTSDRPREARPSSETNQQEAKSTKLQVATPAEEGSVQRTATPKAPKHDEKITFYCTSDDLMAIEQTRLELRAKYGTVADRGRIVRAALSYVLEDFSARGEDSVLLRKLHD